MTDKELKRLSRSELLEIILMLKESEKTLQEENRRLAEKLDKVSKELSARRKALSTDDSLGNSFKEMEKSYYVFKKAINKYCALLEESGADAINGKPELY